MGVGENIALSNEPDPDFTTLWMNSPPHRVNMLDGRYSAAVVGLANVNGTCYAVLLLIAE